MPQIHTRHTLRPSPTPVILPMLNVALLHMHTYRARARPITLPKLHVFTSVVCPCVQTLAPFRDFAGAHWDEGGEFVIVTASTTAIAAPAGGKSAGDSWGDVPEEMGHGDEAAADDARGDFGDPVFRFPHQHRRGCAVGQNMSARHSRP